MSIRNASKTNPPDEDFTQNLLSVETGTTLPRALVIENHPALCLALQASFEPTHDVSSIRPSSFEKPEDLIGAVREAVLHGKVEVVVLSANTAEQVQDTLQAIGPEAANIHLIVNAYSEQVERDIRRTLGDKVLYFPGSYNQIELASLLQTTQTRKA